MENVVGDVRPGDIILMHSIHPVTVEALPEIIKKLKAKGYQFLLLDKMLGVNPYQ